MNIVAKDVGANLASMTMYTMLKGALDSGTILVLQNETVRVSRTSIPNLYQITVRIGGDMSETGKPLPFIEVIACLATIMKVKHI